MSINTAPVRRWTVKRSGDCLSVHGYDADDRPVKLTGIDRVEPVDGRILAIAKNGKHTALEAAA